MPHPATPYDRIPTRKGHATPLPSSLLQRPQWEEFPLIAKSLPSPCPLLPALLLTHPSPKVRTYFIDAPLEEMKSIYQQRYRFIDIQQSFWLVVWNPTTHWRNGPSNALIMLDVKFTKCNLTYKNKVYRKIKSQHRLNLRIIRNTARLKLYRDLQIFVFEISSFF